MKNPTDDRKEDAGTKAIAQALAEELAYKSCATTFSSCAECMKAVDRESTTIVCGKPFHYADIISERLSSFFDEKYRRIAEMERAGWISTKDRMPKRLETVLVCYVWESGYTGKVQLRVAMAQYIPPRSVLVQDFLDPDSDYSAEEWEYSEEHDDCWLPESWYEKAWENCDNSGWYLCDGSDVSHWRLLPELPVDVEFSATKTGDTEEKECEIKWDEEKTYGEATLEDGMFIAIVRFRGAGHCRYEVAITTPVKDDKPQNVSHTSFSVRMDEQGREANLQEMLDLIVRCARTVKSKGEN